MNKNKKVFVTADLHLDNHQDFSHILGTGINSRLQLQLDAVEEMFKAKVVFQDTTQAGR